MLLCLMMSQTACVSIPKPSDDLLQDCNITYPANGRLVNSDVVRLAKAREYDLKECNIDKKALRAYYETVCKGMRSVCSDERTLFRKARIK